MADVFDPADFAAWKGSNGAPAPAAPTAGPAVAFDPDEFAAFKARQTSPVSTPNPFAPNAAENGQDRALTALAPFFERGVSARNSSGQWTDEARARLTKEGIDPLTLDQKGERDLQAKWDATQRTGSDAAAVGRGLLNGIPIAGPAVLGGANRMAAFIRAIQNGTPYSDELKNVEAFGERTAAASPVATGLSEFAGGVVGTAPLVAATPAAFGAGTAALPVRAMTAGLTGATMGAADATARGQDALEAAKTGAALGVVAPVAGAAIGSAVGAIANRVRPQATMTAPEIKAAAQAAYKQADDAGVQISADAFERGFQGIDDAVKKAGFNERLYPRSAIVLDELERVVGSAPTLQQVELLRRVARGAADAPDAAERRIGNIILDKLDDFTGKLKPADVVAGDAEAATASLGQARELWQRYSKARTLETGMDRAERGAAAASGGAAADATNTTRQTIRRILDDPRKAAAYAPDEIAEMEGIVRGGPAQRALRLIAKAAPQNGIMHSLAGLSAATHDLRLGAIPVAGAAAKVLADRNTNSAIRRLNEAVRNGGALGPNPAAIAASEGAEDLTRYLLAPVPAYATR